METIWRKLWGSNDDSTVNPETGLTNGQVKLVKTTWAIAYKDPTVLGVAIMSCFFERHPDYQPLFVAFKDVPAKDLPANKKFQAHALNVVGALNSVIDMLSDGGLLEATLVSLGKRHKIRGQTKEQFLHLKLVVLDVLRQSLGDKFTSETEEAWNKTLDAAYTHIFKGLSSS